MRPAEKRTWHLDRGVPIAGILSFGLLLAVQTIAVVRYMSGIEFKVEQGAGRQVELSVRLDKLDTKVDAIARAMTDASVPSALNAARISALEVSVQELRQRVAENERKLTAESLRNRVARER